ncbi:MAG: LamG domain-containing protein [Bacteroidota bacterium]|nr:LamG domain-containing protein [Bacteroidota bacterium]
MKTIKFFTVLSFCAVVAFCGCKKSSDDNDGGNGTDHSADTIAASHLVGYWKFNGDVVDKKAHSDTAHNVTYTTDRFGNINSAYKGSATTYVTVVPKTDLKVGSITMSVWLRAQQLTGGTSFILSYVDPSIDWNAGYGLWQEGSSRTDTLRYKGFFMHQNSSVFTWLDTQYGQTANVQFSTSKWIHLVYTYDGNTSIRGLYLNGAQIMKDTIKYNNALMGPITVPATATNFYIGKNPNTAQSWLGNYLGDMDDLRIYNTALTSSQVKKLYDSENTVEGN